MPTSAVPVSAAAVVVAAAMTVVATVAVTAVAATEEAAEVGKCFVLPSVAERFAMDWLGLIVAGLLSSVAAGLSRQTAPSEDSAGCAMARREAIQAESQTWSRRSESCVSVAKQVTSTLGFSATTSCFAAPASSGLA